MSGFDLYNTMMKNYEKIRKSAKEEPSTYRENEASKKLYKLMKNKQFDKVIEHLNSLDAETLRIIIGLLLVADSREFAEYVKSSRNRGENRE